MSSSDAGVPTSDHDQTTLLSRKSSRLMKEESVRGNMVATMIVPVPSSHWSLSASLRAQPGGS